MSTNTRRVYLSSNDTTESYSQNRAMKIDLRSANIGCKPNEYLAVSLVRASLPTTLTPTGLTTELYANPTTPTDFPPKEVQVLTWTHSGTEYHLFFNDMDNINGTIANSRNCFWTVTTDMTSLVWEMNQLMGSEVLGINVGDMGELRRLQVNNFSSASDSVVFSGLKTSQKIQQAFGLYDAIDTIVGQNLSPYQYNTSAVGTDIYVRTNLGFSSFISYEGGQNDNILAGIPLVASTSAVGLKLLSSSVVSAEGSSSTAETLDTMINYTNFALSGAHKPISQNKVGEVYLELVDSRGVSVGTGVGEWDVVLEFKRVRVD